MKSTAILLVSLVATIGAASSSEASSSSHEEAVLELFQVMGLERAMVGGATAMIDAQVMGNPDLAPYRDTMLKWAEKYLTWESMAPRLIEIHMEAFTEPETREILAFYRTPTGQKALKVMPELMQKGAAIGAEVGMAHQVDLERMVLERKRQLEADSDP